MAIGVDKAFERLLANPGVVFLLGGIDTGKTTFGIELTHRAVSAHISTAIVDADIVLSTVGPPTTVGLKLCGPGTELTRAELRAADGLGFVGSFVPKGHLLPLVTSTAKLVAAARAAGAQMIVVDTSSLVSGLYGQLLKFFKMDLLHPDFVVGFERGGELEPVIGAALIMVLRNYLGIYFNHWIIILGLVYIATVLYAPKGILGALHNVRSRLWRPDAGVQSEAGDAADRPRRSDRER
jgi:hypothetical protein